MWTLKTHVITEARRSYLALKVYDNNKLQLPESMLASLADFHASNSHEIPAELKYGPDHNRINISAGKLNLSRVSCNHGVHGVEPHIACLRQFVN